MGGTFRVIELLLLRWTPFVGAVEIGMIMVIMMASLREVIEEEVLEGLERLVEGEEIKEDLAAVTTGQIIPTETEITERRASAVAAVPNSEMAEITAVERRSQVAREAQVRSVLAIQALEIRAERTERAVVKVS